ncbi:hypothetical protein JHK84_050813 [Glycine max]|nr:hypothetical protein JHK84_050813 [Glycine max]
MSNSSASSGITISFLSSAEALRKCGNCGPYPVPYPLSTGTDCGNPWYKIRCTEGTLWFDALAGTSYPIRSIDPLARRIITRPASPAPKSCVSTDFRSEGMHLNETLPFSMASGNTVFLFNCTAHAPSMNCTASGACHSYVKKHADFGACVRVGVCCEYKSGGTRKEYVVRVHDGGCAAYQSLVDLNGTTAVAVGKRWPEPGVGIEWVAPQERVCTTPIDCKELLNSKEIKKATNDFSQENLIGSGGFGEVFKGTFDDGTVFAIKRAKLGSTKGIDQMQNEVQILCQVNHRSLVRLLGCCLELEHPLLIYEYISNGTLFNYLHRHSSGSREPLKWHQRLKIAHQTAEGLCYLHSAAEPPIYHRDVKSSNILLDDNLDAKVSDFGLSRLVELAEENNSHIFASAQGTRGYLDLEYYRNFQLTDKSDVYGFGVVLMELLTAQKAIDFNREEESVNLAMYGKRKMVEDKLMDVVDPLLKEGANELELETMKSLGYLATACLDEQRQKGPSMKEVAGEIEYMIKIVRGQISKS